MNSQHFSAQFEWQAVKRRPSQSACGPGEQLEILWQSKPHRLALARQLPEQPQQQLFDHITIRTRPEWTRHQRRITWRLQKDLKTTA